MRFHLFGRGETQWWGLRRLPLRPCLFPAIGTWLFLLNLGMPSALAAADFAPLPKESTVTITNAVIRVSPAVLNFGSVPMGKSATNTFLVENIGWGKLVGTASVSAPFKIISGGKYDLKEREVQVVTVTYTPRRGGTNAATVKFTGGGGAKATVTGRAQVTGP